MLACPNSNKDSNDRKSNFGFIMSVLIFGLLLAFLIAFSMAHAVERHGTDAVIVKTCQETSGNFETWDNPETNRSANIVCLPDGRFGLEICESDGSMVTCFIKDKMKRIEQVYNYLKNRGYTPPSE